jgi:hypothetical protein
VPKTIVNDTIEILGGLPQDLFVSQALAPFLPAAGEPEDQPEG